MRINTKKIVAATAIGFIALLGIGAPAEAGNGKDSRDTQRNVWCC